MLQRPNNLLPLFTFFIFLSFWDLNGVVSDPQTNLVSRFCNPYDGLLVSNISIFDENLNATLRDIRKQITEQNKHFATAQEANGGNPAATLFQCRNYLSVADDCVACFDVAAVRIHSCAAGSPGGFVVYDGCFLRYDASNAFFGETTPSINSVRCDGNQTADGEATAFDSTAQQVLTNLQTRTPTATGFSAATKMQVPANNNNNAQTIYAFAQCIETITQNQCLSCLNAAYRNLQTCFPNSDGKAFANGCFMRYSTTSFFPDNQTFHIVPLIKHGSNNKKGTIKGVIVGGVAFVLILLALLAWIKRPKRPERSVPRGDLSAVSKLKGPINFTYSELKFATKNFSAENKLGEGGFGAVYKGTLKNGNIVAVKKLTLRQSKKVEEEFESEVKLINNVHHRNLIRLLGCCSKGNERILIYEYMKNTSLDKFLFGKNRGSLSWKQRYDIILGTARGLAYLHEEFHVRIIHRDIKTNNILLDDDLQPRIADFGLARLLPEEKTHLSTKFAGTLGYTAPEYAIHGQLSEKADIYSYGVVVLEVMSGERSNELNFEGEFLIRKAWKLYERGIHIELVDDTLDPNDYNAEEVKKIIEIGLLCTQASAELRPSMSEVIVLLQGNDLLENMMKPTMPILIET
ncbi:cysteine-rich receptor-like protein kinase 3 [Neltuma alba]|uniref:cysteine-rich receptor-like protein kinase 3 n=1 Tax=Neltuma alba TaxID=207710 RepID=UPI0010A34687|nr:cysteine-rich receptor-like protein kinase 3 [Prosopis alba]